MFEKPKIHHFFYECEVLLPAAACLLPAAAAVNVPNSAINVAEITSINSVVVGLSLRFQPATNVAKILL